MKEPLFSIPAPTVEDLGQIREAVGFSQLELAQLMGVSRVTVNRWEVGEREPSTRDLEAALSRMVEALPDKLYSWSDVARNVRRVNKSFEKTHPRKHALVLELLEGTEARILTLCRTIVAGADLAMPQTYWEALFRSRSHVYDGLPTDEGPEREVILLGLDVGVALDGAIRGMTYEERADQLGGLRSFSYEESGSFRLAQESATTLRELESWVDQLPRTKEEWRAFNPDVVYEDEPVEPADNSKGISEQ